ncbi:protealysin inhibitor emfourin [Nocardia pseudobrasiliensis]|uniref:Lipoprotein n=1 Tax=Nocardia pseudobrasiliensis TaxID=45979 RepID=A0A370HR56_9NOCA|nr:protealysin inhibitor emfourin [Nocardia pseudobrasiliensis]RDI60441.1 hypothetical protein DFR76_11571 [Nocardia pseudobrasiliensis]
MGELRSHHGHVPLLVLSAAVVGALVLASAACGRTSETRSGTGTSKATSVEVNRTGGFAGVNEFYTVDGSVEDQRRGKLFDMVGSEQFRALKDSYTEPNGCRDSYSYAVTVTYSNSGSKRVTTEECSQAPQLLSDVITLTKEIGHRRGGN